MSRTLYIKMDMQHTDCAWLRCSTVAIWDFLSIGASEAFSFGIL